MQHRIQIDPGCLTIAAPIAETDLHQHTCWQVVLGDDWQLLLDDQTLTGSYVIAVAPGTAHALRLSQGVVMLLEQQSAVGRWLKQEGAGREYFPLGCDSALSSDGFRLWIEQQSQHQEVAIDTQISQLLAQLDGCLVADCIKPPQWRAAQVARQLGWSESHFLYRFKQCMGVPWRPYLKWRRLQCALLALQRGQSATDAAYAAGFSDSAHLSRTFRQQFGMTIRQALRQFL